MTEPNPRIRLCSRFLGLGLLTMMVPAELCAQTEPVFPTDPGEARISAELDSQFTSLDSGLLGDTISLDTGLVEFTHTDVSIPGNSGLEVAFRRSYAIDGNDTSANLLGGWNIELPRITARVPTEYYQVTTDAAPPSTTYTWHDNLCTGSSGFRIDGPPSAEYYNGNNSFWSGVQMRIPGEGSRLVIDANNDASAVLGPSTPPKTTTDHWLIDCIGSIQNGSSEGFVATSPRGLTYYFDYMTTDTAPGVDVVQYGQQCGWTTNTYWYHVWECPPDDETRNGGVWVTYGLATEVVSIWATRVEDTYGNWVEYSYDGNGRPTRIHSNDNREITIGYGAGERIATVSANGRTWRYTYDHNTPYDPDPITAPNYAKLTQVELPDGRSWQFDLPVQTIYPPAYPCYYTGDAGTHSVTHPSGMRGEFSFRRIKRGMTAVPRLTTNAADYHDEWQGELVTCNDYLYPTFSIAKALVSKRLIDLDGSIDQWIHSYQEDEGSWEHEAPANPTPSHDWRFTKVMDPEGGETTYWYDRRHLSETSGLLMKSEVRDNGQILQTTQMEYEVAPSMGSSTVLFQLSPPRTAERPIKGETLTRGSDVYETDYLYDYSFTSATYSYGRPTNIERSSLLSGGANAARSTEIQYAHNLSVWVLGNPSFVYQNGTLFDSYTYNQYGRVTTHDRFGSDHASFGYHASGTQAGAIAWRRTMGSDGTLSRLTAYDDWHRGSPRLVTFPDNTSFSRTIDQNGWLLSATDPMGSTVSYEYNSVGWLTKVDRPVPYEDSSISYLDHGTSSFRRRVWTGAREDMTWFDGFYRAFMTYSSDLSNQPGTSSYIRSAYDSYGRQTYASFPKSTWVSSSNSPGITTRYDPLGRVVETSENVAPYATTSYRYLSQNRVEVTDPEGNITTTKRSGYGSPDDGEVLEIQQPEGITTAMTYDDWGNMLTARQYGTANGYSADATQHYVYDNRFRLCRHYTPETGAKLFAYNTANELTDYVEGRSGTTGCGGVSGAGLVSLTYDAMGRLDITNFSDSTPDIDRSYDSNGNLTQVVRGTTVWDYAYSYGGEMDYLIDETLAIDGHTFRTQYDYDSLGSLEAQVFPSGRRITFTPDALGRPTEASLLTGTSYADQITYHPGGQIASLSYWNGVTFSQNLNARQLPERRSFNHSSGPLVDYAYAYDSRAKITHLNNLVTPGDSVDYVYDDVGRLSSTNGPWGASSYQYDPLGNIRFAEREAGGADLFAIAVGYDDRGNVTNDGQYGFTYDLANQPITMTGAVTASYVYDGNLKRAKQTIDGQTIYSVYGASGALIHRLEGTESTDYIRASGMAVARVKDTSSGTEVSSVHTDHLGSPVAATGASGTLLWRDNRTPFGEPWGAQDPANDNSPGFTGHIEDTATGLTYMQARYYNPVWARFLSNDPVSFSPNRADMFGRYTYAANDPVNLIDPDGEAFVAPLVYWGAIALAGAVIAADQAGAFDGLKDSLNKAVGGLISNNDSDDGVFDVDPDTGKVKDPDLGAIEVSDGELEQAIGELEESLGARQQDNDSYPKGNPNGTPEEQRQHERHKGHQERIDREFEKLEELQDRLPE